MGAATVSSTDVSQDLIDARSAVGGLPAAL